MSDDDNPHKETETFEQRIQKGFDASASLEKKWEDFQNLFNKMNNALAKALCNTMGVQDPTIKPVPPKLSLSGYDLAAAADVLRRANKVVALIGAGVNADIPDFRSPNVGLYAIIEKMNLPQLQQPQDFFTKKFISENPKLFFKLAVDLKFIVPPSEQKKIAFGDVHRLLASLASAGKLGGVITTNIDDKEAAAGIPNELILQAHGTFSTWRCMDDDSHAVSYEQIWAAVSSAGEVPVCAECGAVARPNVVLFGEPMPESFPARKDGMLADCDCLIVAGTSLSVMPAAAIPSQAPTDAVRILLNNELVGHTLFQFKNDGTEDVELIRDIALIGDCQLMARRLMQQPQQKQQPTAAAAAAAASFKTPPRPPPPRSKSFTKARVSPPTKPAAKRSPQSRTSSTQSNRSSRSSSISKALQSRRKAPAGLSNNVTTTTTTTTKPRVTRP